MIAMEYVFQLDIPVMDKHEFKWDTLSYALILLNV